jgi:hypothetical protein
VARVYGEEMRNRLKLCRIRQTGDAAGMLRLKRLHVRIGNCSNSMAGAAHSAATCSTAVRRRVRWHGLASTSNAHLGSISCPQLDVLDLSRRCCSLPLRNSRPDHGPLLHAADRTRLIGQDMTSRIAILCNLGHLNQI